MREVWRRLLMGFVALSVAQPAFAGPVMSLRSRRDPAAILITVGR